MNAPTRVGVFAAGLAVLFGAAFGVGRIADLGMPTAEWPAHGRGVVTREGDANSSARHDPSTEPTVTVTAGNEVSTHGH